MILRESTIKYSGRDPDKLKPKSHVRICVSCNECGRVRWVSKDSYRDLCQSCTKIGKNNPFYGKHHSDESKIKIGDAERGKLNHNYGKHGKDTTHFGRKHSQETKDKWSKNRSGKGNNMYGSHRIGENAPNWKGGISGNREHVKHIRDCIKLNTKFKGSNAHHIMSGVIIYIPKNIHKLIWHNMKSGQGMKEINKLAINYLIGEL